MSAREVIAIAIHFAAEDASADDMADSILAHLREDGYRILAPGEIDPETKEAVARYIEKQPSFGDGKWAARHVRSLSDKEPRHEAD